MPTTLPNSKPKPTTKAVADLLEPQPGHEAFPLNYASTGHIWTCPHTGFRIAKTLATNIAQRKKVLKLAEADTEFAAGMLAMCRKSPLLFINLFGMTVRQHAVNERGQSELAKETVVPMVTWPAQDHAINRIWAAYREQRSILLDKSRDQGATWLCLFFFVWVAIFEDDSFLKVVSRREDEVDSPGLPNTLFAKVDAIIEYLPEWLKPGAETKTLHRGFDNGSAIDGESTNDHVARGTRLKGLMIDEAAAIENLRAVDHSTNRAANFRIFNSTPLPGSFFTEMRFSGKMEVVTLGWWNHPEQGVGRYLRREEGNKVVWHNKFRQAELDANSRMTVALNLDIDHLGAGHTFFEQEVIGKHKQTYASIPPKFTFEPKWAKKGLDRDDALTAQKFDTLRLLVQPRGVFRWWGPLYKDPKGRPRPHQKHQHAIGADISLGTGASNSVLCVIDAELGQQVGELATAALSPEEFARLSIALGLWIGGPNGCALLAWENNGVGEIFSNVVRKIGYPWVYRHGNPGAMVETLTDRIGWKSSRENKKSVLGEVREAMATQELKVYSPECLTEMGKYIIGKSAGQVVYADSESWDADAKEVHGDRVIALSVCWHAALRLDKMPPPVVRAPVGTFAYWEEKEAEEEAEASRYDY